MLGGSNNPKPLAMSGGFLPQDYVEKKAELRASVLGGVMFLLVMGGVAGAYLVTTGRWSEIRSQQSVIDEAYEAEAKKIEQLKALEAQRTTMLEKAEIVTSLIEPVPRSVLLAELMLRMPSGVSLLDFELKGKRVEPPAPPPPTTGTKSLSGSQPRGGAVTQASAGKDGKGSEPAKPKVQAPRFDVKVKITGVAKAQGEIADYLASLNSCDLLEKVELLYIQDTIIKDVDLRKFEIEAMIRPGADGRAPRPEMPGAEKPATQMTSVGTDTPAAAGRGE